MNLVKGDTVTWRSPVFSGGSFFRGRCTGAKFLREDILTGVIIKDSYGKKTGQHTFTIQLADGSLKRVKGRNLYGNITEHKPGAAHEVESEAKAARVASSIEFGGERVPARFRI